MLSPYCQQLSEDLNLGSVAVPKLVPNLNDKTNYIVHYRNLKLYLSLGMEEERRKHAANDFEKDFYKLMNNAVFGKTMGNLRKRVNVKLVYDETKLSKLTDRPSFDSFCIFSEDLAAVNMKKTKLYLNRPIYVGFATQFHYEYMKQKYRASAKLLFTTRIVCYEVKTRGIY
ncbi:Hypothetical predicted protein [Paramuricea clavata]|uniref:Uncharacterized protein n=1 Tax=Paramuricea clavata TaxID=317549 RepID=A0A6S7FTV0_PARCT|nr:Hypothetical predicted protein [Paramuricea clavata]